MNCKHSFDPNCTLAQHIQSHEHIRVRFHIQSLTNGWQQCKKRKENGFHLLSISLPHIYRELTNKTGKIEKIWSNKWLTEMRSNETKWKSVANEGQTSLYPSTMHGLLYVTSHGNWNAVSPHAHRIQVRCEMYKCNEFCSFFSVSSSPSIFQNNTYYHRGKCAW